MTSGHEANDIERFDDDGADKDRQFVTALARGLELLRCFGPGERFLGITEMARRTGIPKPSVSRLAGTLTKLGYLEFSEGTGKYRLGAGVLSFSYSLLSNMDVRQVARSRMQELAEHSQLSVSIAARDRLSMVYVESVRSSASIASQLGVGSRLSLATSAMGRAFLVGCAPGERDELLEQIRLKDEARWPRIKAGIEQAMRDYAERGFCISMGDWNENICGVGVPFSGPDGRSMAFNCGGPIVLTTRELLENEIGPRLVELVQTVGRAMGRA